MNLEGKGGGPLILRIFLTYFFRRTFGGVYLVSRDQSLIEKKHVKSI
jgi:hypothetical protein